MLDSFIEISIREVTNVPARVIRLQPICSYVTVTMSSTELISEEVLDKLNPNYGFSRFRIFFPPHTDQQHNVTIRLMDHVGLGIKETLAEFVLPVRMVPHGGHREWNQKFTFVSHGVARNAVTFGRLNPPTAVLRVTRSKLSVTTQKFRSALEKLYTYQLHSNRADVEFGLVWDRVIGVMTNNPSSKGRLDYDLSDDEVAVLVATTFDEPSRNVRAFIDKHLSEGDFHSAVAEDYLELFRNARDKLPVYQLAGTFRVMSAEMVDGLCPPEVEGQPFQVPSMFLQVKDPNANDTSLCAQRNVFLTFDMVHAINFTPFHGTAQQGVVCFLPFPQDFLAANVEYGDNAITIHLRTPNSPSTRLALATQNSIQLGDESDSVAEKVAVGAGVGALAVGSTAVAISTTTGATAVAGLFGTAGTGTAISSLSGAAATNAAVILFCRSLCISPRIRYVKPVHS
eukprot:PhF_6_TR6803/c0_g1_i2/m.9789